MNRTFLFASGIVLWVAVAGDVLVHVLDGDVLVPAGMAALFALYVGLRQVQTRHVRVAVPVTERG